MQLTHRQLEHLRHLADGAPHKAWPGRFSSSVYCALARKGLAECLPTSPLKWRINDVGRSYLTFAEAVQLTPGAQREAS